MRDVSKDALLLYTVQELDAVKKDLEHIGERLTDAMASAAVELGRVAALRDQIAAILPEDIDGPTE